MMETVRFRAVPRNTVRSRLVGVLTALVALGGVAVTPATAATASLETATPATPATPATASVATPVPLGTAASFAVLGRDAVTNTGTTVITGDLGVSPGSALTGFPPGTVTGTVHQDDAVAQQAQADLTVAYDNAAGQAVDATLPAELGGTTLTPGVYDSATGAFQITGNLTLDGQGDPNAVFILRTTSTLITAGASAVTLAGSAQAANVFWQVGSAVTLGAGSTLVGNVLSLDAITATTGATVVGRLLSRGGAITLDTDTISLPLFQACGTATTTTTLTSTCPLGDSGPITLTATVTSSDGTVPTGEVAFAADGVAPVTVPLGPGGVATLTTSDLPAGVNRVVATYTGTAQLDPSTSPVLIQRVDLGCPCTGALPGSGGVRGGAGHDDGAGPAAGRETRHDDAGALAGRETRTRVTAACGRRS